jgi:hypothetical protein
MNRVKKGTRTRRKRGFVSNWRPSRVLVKCALVGIEIRTKMKKNTAEAMEYLRCCSVFALSTAPVWP